MTRQYTPDTFDLLGEPAPLGTKDASRWEWWADRGIPGQSLLDRLEFEEFMGRQGWNFSYGPGFDTNGRPCVVALFAAIPQTATDEAAWEKRNEAMYANQTPLVIADKPTEETMRGRGGFLFNRATATEDEPAYHPGVPDFYDSPMSTKHFTRGD